MLITILKPANGLIPTKTHHIEKEVVKTSTYPNMLHYYASREEVNDIFSLSKLVTKLEEEGKSIVIRGGLHQDTDIQRPIKRRKHDQDRQDGINEHPIIDLPQQWLCIDIDNFPLPDGISVLGSPEDSVRHCINHFPEQFHDASVHVQFSASAGIKDPSVLNAHLWFWLNAPVSDYSLRQWARSYNQWIGFKLIDTALFSSNQIHYIARPIFDNFEDPLPKRSFFIQGALNEVNTGFLSTLDNQIKFTTDDRGLRKHIELCSVHGYENILVTLGDHEEGDGFYWPLLRATGSIVNQMGQSWFDDRENRGAVINDLKRRIQEAETNRTIEELGRYLSDGYLNNLIDGALNRGFGRANDHVEPYFPSMERPLEEAEEGLDGLLMGIFGQYIHDREFGERDLPARNFIIKCSAGLGKSESLRERVTVKNLSLGGKHVEVYIPRYDLADEFRERLIPKLESIREERNDDDKKQYPIHANIIKGYNQKDPHGNPICRKHEQAKALSDRGFSVEFHLCGTSREDGCEFFDDCEYMGQYHYTEYQEELNGVYIPAVNILTHEHMFLQKREKLKKPSLVIVDESFLKAGIQEFTVVEDALLRTSSIVMMTVYTALNTDKPLLGHLRENRITPDVLRNEAGNYKQPAPDISPWSSGQEQVREIGKLPAKDYLFEMLSLLATELETTDRDESFTTRLVRTQNSRIIKCAYRKELTIPEDVPMIFLDADANENLIRLFRPDAELFEFVAERMATVFQVKDLTFSKKSMDDGKIDLEKVSRFVSSIAETGRTLVICNNSHEGQFKELFGGLDNIAIEHFHNIKGIDEYKDYDNVITIGREQPNSQEMEAQARALWWDKNIEIETSVDQNENRTYQTFTRGIRTRQMIPNTVRVQAHPEPKVQQLLELSREHELAQAIDRLRLVRTRAGHERNVIIMTSVPLDITVDHLFSWKHMEELYHYEVLCDGVIPLNNRDLMKCDPTINTVPGAREITARLKETGLLISSLIRESVSIGSYKIDPTKPGRNNEVIIFGCVENPKEILEQNLGTDIGRFRRISEANALF